MSNVLTKTHTPFRLYDPSSAKPVVQYYEREPVGVNFNKNHPIDGLRVTDKTLTSQILLTSQEHFTLFMSFL